jgi:AraC family transcriptional regulator, regulatory protein of adaptative response / DNA-3-methyladenine glycosylase II
MIHNTKNTAAPQRPQQEDVRKPPDEAWKIGYIQAMELDEDTCYRIIQARDARYDGTFFTAVTSTGIYCRPICPARTPKRENVRFYRCAASAEGAGFRPCKRCRPETAPGTPAWNGTSTTVSRALRLVGNGFLDERSVSELATALGMGERHLRRLFVEHLGAAPAAIALSRRAHFAARMLRDTRAPIAQIALGAGFGSIRQFNDVFRSVFGEPPSAARKAAAPARRGRQRLHSRSFTLALSYRPPIQWEALLAFFRKRAVAGVEEVTDTSYRRSVCVGAEPGTIEVTAARARDGVVTVSVEGIDPSALGVVVRRVRRMFDLDADPLQIARHLQSDKRLAPLVRAAPGLRIPATGDAFEAAVRAVLGQQVSVAGAITVAGRLVALCGRELDATGGIRRVFPTPAELALADLSGIGIPASRARTLANVARAALGGPLRLDGFARPDELALELQAIPGIGPWSAQYVALRGLGEPDAFPETDLGIRKALDSLGYPKQREERSRAIARLAPWRGYAALYLWNSLSQRGDT